MLRRASIALLCVVLAIFALPRGDLKPPKPAEAGRTMGYGFIAYNLADAGATGFNYTRLFVGWNDLEPERGVYDSGRFQGLANIVNDARAAGLLPIMNIRFSPYWATGSTDQSMPPNDDADLANFMIVFARYFKGQVAGYEIWNEPNLRIEWGNQIPNAPDESCGNPPRNCRGFPVRYASMMRAVYPAIKSVDPDAMVITGGLSTTGDSANEWNYGDLLWIVDLYTYGNIQSCGPDGKQSCFDAIGSHPYGGPYWPEVGPTELPDGGPQYTVGMYFRRPEQQRQMMEVFGQDYDRSIFITELSWLLNPAVFGWPCQWQYPWTEYVLPASSFPTPDQQEIAQADYLVRAFNYAYTNWPWVSGMIVSSLDLGAYLYDCDPTVWYSLTRTDSSRRPAYYAMRDMAKPGIPPAFIQPARSQATLMLPVSSLKGSTRVRVSNPSGGLMALTVTSSASWLSGSWDSAEGELEIFAEGIALPPNTWEMGFLMLTVPGALNSPLPFSVRVYAGQVYSATIEMQRAPPQ